MELKDRRISHLRNLGETKQSAIKSLEEELERGSNFIEIAEITDVVEHRDGGIPNKRVGYVAGICGSKNAKNEFDLGEDVYSLVYFKGMVKKDGDWKHGGGTIYFPSVFQLTDYVPLNTK